MPKWEMSLKGGEPVVIEAKTLLDALAEFEHRNGDLPYSIKSVVDSNEQKPIQ